MQFIQNIENFAQKNKHPMMQKLATKIYGMLRSLKLISTPAI
jgi:hypothetical protein